MTKPPDLLNFNFSQRLTVRHRGKEEEDEAALTPRQQMRERISRRAALEFHDGMYGILAQTNIIDFFVTRVWVHGQLRIFSLYKFLDGFVFLVNLGIGIPIHACNYIPEGMKVTLQTENGVLGLVSS